MCLLACTSVNNFQEVWKVMKLPHISCLYKKSNEIISNHNQHAFSICTQTIETIARRAKEENWDATTRIRVMSWDLAGTSSSIQWDYRLNKMVGQFQAHKLKHLNNKFNMMAN